MEAGIGAVLTIIITPLALLKLYLQQKQLKNKDNYILELERKLGK